MIHNHVKWRRFHSHGSSPNADACRPRKKAGFLRYPTMRELRLLLW
jgi:hypothetical protein